MANDLANATLLLIEKDTKAYGLYHYSNKGAATWYDFAKEILTQHSQLNTSNLAKTDHYPTFAKRPVYSVLDVEKIDNVFGIKTIDWKISLKNLIT